MRLDLEDSVDRHVRDWHAAVPGVPLGEFPIFARIMSAGRLYRAALRRVAERRGLAYRDVHVLMALRRAGRALTPSELLPEMSVTMAAITKRIDVLEDAGYVTRKRDPNDGRSVRIALTNAGRRFVDEEIRANRQPEFSVAAAEFSASEAAQLEALLRRLLVRLERVAHP